MFESECQLSYIRFCCSDVKFVFNGQCMSFETVNKFQLIDWCSLLFFQFFLGSYQTLSHHSPLLQFFFFSIVIFFSVEYIIYSQMLLRLHLCGIHCAFDASNIHYIKNKVRYRNLFIGIRIDSPLRTHKVSTRFR